MSFDIGGIGPAQGAPRVGPAAAAKPAGGPVASAGAADEAVEVETMPSSPPPAVMQAISVAAGAYERLQGSGRQLQFATDPLTGRLSAHLQDLEGNSLAPVTPGQVLAIASGEPV